jgi:hypothetical protein
LEFGFAWSLGKNGKMSGRNSQERARQMPKMLDKREGQGEPGLDEFDQIWPNLSKFDIFSLFFEPNPGNSPGTERDMQTVKCELQRVYGASAFAMKYAEEFFGASANFTLKRLEDRVSLQLNSALWVSSSSPHLKNESMG